MKRNHEYPARRLPDGTFEICDVDVFAECSRVNPHTGELDVFDGRWLEAAAERARQREVEGHAVPAHLGFHDPAKESEPPFAGFLRDIRITTEGDQQILRSTLTNVPPEIFEAIQRRRLPYRSVEIAQSGQPEISSLALLESTVPFFKLPTTRPSQMKRIEQGEQWVRRLFATRNDLSDVDVAWHANSLVSAKHSGTVTVETYGVKPDGRTLSECEAALLEDMALCFLTGRREGAADGDVFTPPKTTVIDGQPLFAMRCRRPNDVRIGARKSGESVNATLINGIYGAMKTFFGMKDANHRPVHPTSRISKCFVLAGKAWEHPLGELTKSYKRGNPMLGGDISWSLMPGPGATDPSAMQGEMQRRLEAFHDKVQRQDAGSFARAQVGQRAHAADLARDVVAAFADNPPKPIGEASSPPMLAADAELYRSACDYLIDYFRSHRQPVMADKPAEA